MVIATGATVPRDLPMPGRELSGVHFAMDYLVQANRVVAGDIDSRSDRRAGASTWSILGGGDTGADCLGTAHRQQAASVTTLAIGKQPPAERAAHQPWPTFPTLFEVASAHEEGGERTYLASTVEFLGENGEVTRPAGRRDRVPGRAGACPSPAPSGRSRQTWCCLSLGFTGPEQTELSEQVDAAFDRARQRRPGRQVQDQRGRASSWPATPAADSP